MNDEFREHYQAAERAYAEGRFDDAEQISMSLLGKLENSQGHDEKDDNHANWVSTITLLLGHIALHGRSQPQQAKDWYKRSLKEMRDQTLQDIAENGLKQCEARPKTPASSDLLQDPFINSAALTPPTNNQTTAMPWLDHRPQSLVTTTESAAPAKEMEAKAAQKSSEQEPAVAKDVQKQIQPNNSPASQEISEPEHEKTHQNFPLSSSWIRISVTTNHPTSDSKQQDNDSSKTD